MTPDEKLDEALRETFPASDAFWVAPQGSDDRGTIAKRSGPRRDGLERCSVVTEGP